MSRSQAILLAVLATLLVLVVSWLWSGAAEAVMLAWNPVTGATGYKLYYGTSSQGYRVVLDIGPALEASVSGLSPGIVYYFAATAYNSAGESAFSNEVGYQEHQTPAPIPAPPQIHIVTPTNGQTVPRKMTVPITVAQDAGGPLDRVEIYVSTALLCADDTTPYGCGWTVPPANHRTYQLQAKGIDTAGQIGVSALVEVTSR